MQTGGQGLDESRKGSASLRCGNTSLPSLCQTQQSLHDDELPHLSLPSTSTKPEKSGIRLTKEDEKSDFAAADSLGAPET